MVVLCVGRVVRGGGGGGDVLMVGGRGVWRARRR